MVPETYNCPNCGASIGYQKRCEYCGTILQWRPYTRQVEFVPMGGEIVPLYAEVRISLRRMAEGGITKEMILKELTEEISHDIPRFLTLYEETDIKDMRKVYRARLKVAK